MLNQLMAIKRRREQGARRRLAEAQKKLKELADKLAELKVRQAALRDAWRTSNQQAREVEQHQMQRVQKEINQFFQNDVQHQQQAEELEELQHEVDALIGRQREALQRARIEQEKLIYLLEQQK